MKLDLWTDALDTSFYNFPLITDLPVRNSWEHVFVPVEMAMRGGEDLELPGHKCHVRQRILHTTSYTNMCQYFGSL